MPTVAALGGVAGQRAVEDRQRTLIEDRASQAGATAAGLLHHFRRRTPGRRRRSASGPATSGCCRCLRRTAGSHPGPRW